MNHFKQGKRMTSIKNAESSFTELFNLLKRHDCSPKESPTLAYTTSELKAIHCHVDNATVVLLQGMQDVGNLIGLLCSSKKNVQTGLGALGFFIAMISNLTEALHGLQVDTDYVLRERGSAVY